MEIIILDRDGVINYDSPNYIKTPDEWEAIPGSIDAIANLTQAGFKIVICSNQSGIGRGLFTMQDLNDIHQKMHRLVDQAGGKIAAIFICPHTPENNCECRKPKSKMIIDICARFNVDDISHVAFIGDSMRDLEAISTVGGIPVLVKTGNGKKTLNQKNMPENTLVFESLADASEYLIENKDHARE